MKKMILGFCLLSLGAIVHPQSKPVNRSSYNLLGKVKSLTERIYEKKYWEKGPFQKTGIPDSMVLFFNEKGWLEAKISNHEEGLIEYLDLYREDFSGGTLLIEKIYSPNGLLQKEIVYEYAALPLLLSKAYKKDSDYLRMMEYRHTYDSLGHILVTRQFDMTNQYVWPDSFLSSENVHRYDENSRMVEETYLDVNLETKAVTRTKVEYKYDSKGRMTNERELNARGAIQKEIRYAYGENGKISEYVAKKGDGSFETRETYQYDKKGYMTGKIIYNKEGKVAQQLTYNYDEKGNLISYQWINAAGKQSKAYTYKYKFDDHGNWTLKELLEDGNLISLTERVIEYEQ